MRLSVWRKIRLSLRWTRRGMLGLVVALIVALLWFNQIGLPDFLKKPLVEKLRARGLDVDFVRLRLHVTSGVVAENVRVGGVNPGEAPTIVLAEIQVQPDLRALLHGQFQLEGLALRQGRIVWRYSPTNLISVENINTQLRFGGDDTWSLDNFTAGFAGAKLALSGNITHASAIRDWDIFHGRKPANPAWREQLQRISDAVLKVRPHPQLTLTVNGDGRDVNSFYVNLLLMQGRTKLQVDGRPNDMSDRFQWRVHGPIEPEIIRPFLFTTNAVRGFNHLHFNEPVYLDANVWGRIDQPDSIGASGSLNATNFSVRGEAADQCSGDFTYTNHILEFLTPQMTRGDQKMTADKIILNLDRKLIWFINGFGTADPHAVARAIGPKVGHLLEPYRFDSPPTVRVNGCAPMHDIDRMHGADDADLTFDVLNGRNFQCLKVHAETVTGTIHWLGGTLILTNIVAQLYNGSGNGSALFDFDVEHEGADYQFTATVSNVNLHQAAQDLMTSSKDLEGRLAGRVVVTHGDTRNWRGMDGFGHARVQDGQLWNIAIFGKILSPLINTLVPGANLGNSRATDAEAHFAMTNGVVYSDSLKIQSAMMQMRYDGTVDLDGRVNAHVIAEPLGNVPGIGQLLNVLLHPFSKLFEYKIGGTLKDPRFFPLYVPKELMPGRSGHGKPSTELTVPASPTSIDVNTNPPALDIETNEPSATGVTNSPATNNVPAGE